ncbi:MAG: PD-(D/E)XK motif protein [Acidimicrobiales bacterium]|nr:PD-(D/E)XK motif protein [Acidimicrobiales bacterium]
MSIDDIWQELEALPGDSGFVRRRIEPESKQDLFLAVRKDQAQRVLLLEVGPKRAKLPVIDGGSAVVLGQVHLSKPDRYAVELALTSNAYVDLFSALATDIISAVAPANDVQTAVAHFVGRFERWQAFLRAAGEGLTRHRQRGLFGEVLALRDWLAPAAGATASVAAWTGPANAPQDFSFGPVAVEVKTTAANLHQHLGISSERQLDTSHLDRLFLLHVSVDEQDGVGETLPELVGAVRDLLAADPHAQVEFEDKLLAGGYHDMHGDRYTTGYSLRETNLFEVADGFPAITEGQLPVGVGDVHYSVAVSACTPWATQASVLAEALGQP